jgi:flagellar biosynthesis protein
MTTHKTGEKNTSTIALRYDGDSAPRVIAKGKGHIAEEILAIAQEHDIPLYEDPELIKLLAQLELGDEIPRSLYLAVAEIIAFAYHISGKSVVDSRPSEV